MNFITIEHKEGEITLSADLVDSFHKINEPNEKYHVLVYHPARNLTPYELSKEQYDKIVARFTY